jgi:hypothetical protein
MCSALKTSDVDAWLRSRRKPREPGRGHEEKVQPAVIAWVRRQGAVVIQATRDGTIKTGHKAADLAV